MTRWIGTLAATLTLTACVGLDAGKACETEGDGFTRVDPCAETCVDWAVTCPSGDEVVPDVCSAGPCASDDDCDKDYICVQIDMTDSECLPDAMCD